MQQGIIGRKELVIGGMFSGKTEELIRRLRRARYANQVVQVFGPEVDFRPGADAIKSHNNMSFHAVIVGAAEEIPRFLKPDVQVVGIDELQFLDSAIIDVFEWLSDQGIRVIGAGLPLNAVGEPFGSMAELMVRAHDITTLHAICVVCGAEASCTQLFQGGEPVPWQEEELIIVGGPETGYEARCPTCHDVPRRPRTEF